jgi:DNA-binding transcriptional MerR regulator
LERAWALSAEKVLDAATAGVREGAYPQGSVVCFGTATIYLEGRHRPFEVYTQWLEAPRRARLVIAAADNHELLEAISNEEVRAEVRFSEPYARIPADPWDLLSSQPSDFTLTLEQVEKQAREIYDVAINRRTLRYYQGLGLTPPPRRVPGHLQRRYANDLPARLLAVRRLLAEGHKLGAIAERVSTHLENYKEERTDEQARERRR